MTRSEHERRNAAQVRAWSVWQAAEDRAVAAWANSHNTDGSKARSASWEADAARQQWVNAADAMRA